MKIEIELADGSMSSDCLSESEPKKTVIVYGIVERIRDEFGATEYPTLGVVEKHVLRIFQGGNIRDICGIEGSYFIVCRLDEKVHVFCDKFCLARIYYCITNSKLIISDDLMRDFTQLSISRKNAAQFVNFRFVIGRATLFDNIFRLMPGECLTLHLQNRVLSSQVCNTFPSVEVGVDDEIEAGRCIHECFRNALLRRISRYATKKLIVPLSGGLDSRYIIASLLELVSADQITAVTFGSKGTYDYEIGAAVARAAGVRHVPFPLEVSDYAQEDLIRNCVDSEAQVNFITEAPFRVFEKFERHGEVVVSGYVGDTIMGAKSYPKGMEEQIDIVRSDGLVTDSKMFLYFASPESIADSFYYEGGCSSCLTDFEKWFFSNHFTKYSSYCVFKNRRRLLYISPFIDYEFCDLALNLPMHMRTRRHLYLSEFCRRFPRLASVPLKSYCGAAVNASRTRRLIMNQRDKIEYNVLRIDRRANYIDFRKHMNSLIDHERLMKWSIKILGKKLSDIVFGDNRCALMLYNLRCLELVCGMFQVRLREE
jgi:asparagine synthetase B (glutamine-hydrolysing)